MAEPVSLTRELGRCAARLNDLVYVISHVKSLLAQDIAHVSLVGLYRGAWGDAFNTTWMATAVAVAKLPTERVVLIGEEGEVSTYAGGKRQDEQIQPAPLMIRNARTIAGEVYVCGSKRQVFRRVDEKKWVDVSAPTAAQAEALGFEAIDGYAHDDIYAVGWAGEIWRYDGAIWNACPSPTTAVLTTVCCAPNDVVYAAGQGGVLLAGRNDSWKSAVKSGEVTVDLWDLCWFQGTLYAATVTGLFTLEEGGLCPVETNGAPSSTYSLSTADGVLWSVGNDSVDSFDGRVWTHYA